jgi:hypothetical protein
MKKVLFIAMFSLVISGYTFAQEGYGGGINFAYHSSWILNQNAYGDPELDYVNTFHPAFGLQGFYNLRENLGVWMELDFVTIGQKYEDVSNKITRDVRLKYLSIPIMAKYTSSGEIAKFHFMLGPQFSILTKATQDYQKNGAIFPGNKMNLDGVLFAKGAGDIKDRYNKLDVMLTFDLGADIVITDNLFINAGLRANYGFRDINDEAYRLKNAALVYTKSQNAYFGLQVGLNYMIGK